MKLAAHFDSSNITLSIRVAQADGATEHIHSN